MTKPAVLAATFSVVSYRLRIHSWPLTIAFSLTFFLYSVVEFLVTAYSPGHELSTLPLDATSPLVYLAVMAFSPITLWAPLTVGALAYAIVRRVGSNLRWSGHAA
jgi:hypothetical protein